MKAVFVDSNIFLHFKLWDEIAWLELTGGTEVELIIPQVVIRELENEKVQNPKSHLRDRAADRIRRIGKIIRDGCRSEIGKGIHLTIQDADPHAIDFPSERLRTELKDDWIVASVLQYMRDTPGVAVAVVTDDNGLIAKLVGRKIEYISLPDELKLPAQEDPNQKEMQKLKKENLELQNRMPKFRIESSAKEMDLLTVIKKASETLDHTELTRLAEPKNANDPFAIKMKGYVSKQLMLCVWQLRLVNDGTTPGENIDIIVSAPPHVRLLTQMDKAPSPPPSNPYVLGREIFHPPPLSLPWLQDVIVERKDDGTVSFKVKLCKHGMPIDLPVIYLSYTEDASSRNFTATYDLFCNNLPKVVKGEKLTVLIAEAGAPSNAIA